MFLSALGKHEATTSVVFVSKTANAVGVKNAPTKTLKGQRKLCGSIKLSYYLPVKEENNTFTVVPPSGKT